MTKRKQLEKYAAKLGYYIDEGDYIDTNDNRIGEYYFIKKDTTVIDKRGKGMIFPKNQNDPIYDEYILHLNHLCGLDIDE